MDTYPQKVNGSDETVLCLTVYDGGCMPSGTSVEHVKHHTVVDKEDVTLDLFIELVREIDVGCI